MGRLRTPSPAMGVALLALFVALGGTTWAAVSLPNGSVGNPQLKNNAVTGAKVKNGSLTGADIKLSALGTVPQARRATTADVATSAATSTHASLADNASHATAADLATRALTADVAGTAYTTSHVASIALSALAVPVATLNLPAGGFAVVAKSQIDTLSPGDIGECDLVAGANVDRSVGQGGAAAHASQTITNMLTFISPVAGAVTLTCTGFGTTPSVSQVRLTAIPVANVVAAP